MRDPRPIRHIIESQQFDLELLERIFDRTARFRSGRSEMNLKDKILIPLFYEPSTRTRISFECAMIRLGGHCSGTENASEFSSAIKGESIEDTARVISEYGDVIVVRHTDERAAKTMARFATIPVINGGCGAFGHHPSQALVDAYTIQERRGEIDGLKIAVVGDLKHGRTVRSLVYLLGKYKDIDITFVSPEQLRVEHDILEYLQRHNVSFYETRALEEVIETVDAVYMTRVQKERISGLSDEESTRLARSYRIDATLAGRMRSSAMILHPLPRNDEIDPSVDAMPQALYFRQSGNGMYVRMALLEYIFGS